MAANRGPLTVRIVRVLGLNPLAAGMRGIGLMGSVLCLAAALLAGHALLGMAHPRQVEAAQDSHATPNPATEASQEPARNRTSTAKPSPSHSPISQSTTGTATPSSSASSYIDAMKAAGLGDLTVDQLIALKIQLHVPDVMTEVRRVAKPVTQQTATKRLRVLLVDDSPIARATESALVRALGHHVEEAQDGEEALARLTAQGFDVVLTDIQMPKMDGFTLTRTLKANPHSARIPVIILSSLASPEDRRRGVDAGADAYLIKGELGVESLAQAIDRLT
jgi:CheY-like chemotaxis protein